MRLSKPSLLVVAVLLVLLAVNLGALASKRFHPVLETQSHVEKGAFFTSNNVARRSVRARVGTNGDALLEGDPASNSAAAGGDTPHSVLSKSMQLLAGGKYEDIDGIEAVWQAPPAGTPRRGVMLLVHGCNHGAIDWWPASPSCPNCIGLPEELNVTLHCLLRGYAAVAVSSISREGSRCWQSTLRQSTLGGGDPGDDYDSNSNNGRSSETVDWMRVRRVLDALLPREGLSGPSLPLFALGASSGGAFVLGLPLVMPGRLAGLAVQIMGGRPTGILRRYRSLNQSAPWPPTMFVHMPRDNNIAQLVAANLEELRDGAVRTREIRVRPQPLTRLYLTQRCAPEVDERTSKAVYDIFRSADYLDPAGYLRRNPRSLDEGGWRELLRKEGLQGLEGLRLQPDASPISEELNLLYAGHELSSETTTDMLDWFEGVSEAAEGGASAA